MEKYFTCAEVAELWRVELRTVQNWCAAGKLRAFKAGKDYRIPESALSEFQAANSNEKAG